MFAVHGAAWRSKFAIDSSELRGIYHCVLMENPALEQT